MIYEMSGGERRAAGGTQGRQRLSWRNDQADKKRTTEDSNQIGDQTTRSSEPSGASQSRWWAVSFGVSRGQAVRKV